VSERFLDPFGRTLFQRPRPDGSLDLEIAPGQWVCDFCCNPGPTWQYPCGPVLLAGNPNATASDDEWAACDECRALIDARNVGSLVERIVAEQARQPLAAAYTQRPLSQRRRLARENVVAFLRAQTGPARPIR
jgi:hypothetical protein